MMSMQRTVAPDFHKTNWKKWTREYIQSGNWNTSFHNKHAEILETLRQSTHSHCAFCDDLLYPEVGEMGQIEHFRPKNSFRHFAYVWGNLYPICQRCNNTKGERFDYLLLQPDSKAYIFSDWFRLDLSTFKLLPEKLGNSNWKRAEKTIELYGLNKADKIERRKKEFCKIKDGNYKNQDNQPFRFIKII